MKITRPLYAVPLRMLALPVVLLLLLVEYAGEYAHDAIDVIDRHLP